MNEPGRIANSTDEHTAKQLLPPAVEITHRREARRASAPHARKFLLAGAVLAAIAVAAIVVAVSILARHRGGSSSEAAVWSAWKPSDGGIAGEREIANQVSPFYRATPANQLVVVTAQNVSSNGNGTQIALRDPNNGSLSGLSGTSAIYTLCGLGPGCAISAGTPSAARLLLLRREALELALYTFRYIGGVDNVVALLPPGHTSTTEALTSKPPSPGRTTKSSPVHLAVVFQRDSLRPFLGRPLRMTLPEQLPPTVSQMQSAPEAELVSVVTGQGLFDQRLVQTQDGSNVLVLSPLPSQ